MSDEIDDLIRTTERLLMTDPENWNRHPYSNNPDCFYWCYLNQHNIYVGLDSNFDPIRINALRLGWWNRRRMKKIWIRFKTKLTALALERTLTRMGEEADERIDGNALIVRKDK